MKNTLAQQKQKAMQKYYSNHVLRTFFLHVEKDYDLLEYWDSLPYGEKSATVRESLRAHARTKPLTR